MKSIKRLILSGTLSVLVSVTGSYAQTTTDAELGSPELGPSVPRQRSIADDRVPPERVLVQERLVERKHEGELYVAGFGGFTLGHSFSHPEGRGSLAGQTFDSFDLANSVIYGMKIGYFHPGRLNWLGLEVEGFNTTPHLQQQNSVPGTYLRVSTLAFNVIARKRLACRADDPDAYDGTRRTTRYDKDDRRYYEAERTATEENARCPLQVYAGAGPAIFFAETSNQFGRSGDNGEVGVNALAGMKYFVHRNVAVFGEYKFNYAGFDFTQLQGTTAGIQGNYKASHFVGGLAIHF
ncbi:MAG: hypothetical protein IPM58_12835 [Nitrospira sp.]|nr:hypothetical protein [Nitrospira sp.]